MMWSLEVETADEARLWRLSGADLLTGYADGPPEPAPGAPASVIHAALADIARRRPASSLPGVELLSDRANDAGFSRRAPWSCGGSFRAVQTEDGWLGLSLARESDIAAVPALVEHEPTGSVWADVRTWAAGVSTSAASSRVALLGLPGGPIPERVPAARRAPVEATAGRGRLRHAETPLVVDLSSLWAGPLCGDLLARTGARVVKVESRARRDGARSGSRAFFNRMNGLKDVRLLDFDDERDVARLQALIDEADVVIEASRPRALRALGVNAHAAAHRGAVWVSLTAYGRNGPDGMRVGFGDDVAASASFVRWGRDGPYPVGDALADPLTGVVAAHAAVQALDGGAGALLDVSMFDVASWARRLCPADLRRQV